MPLIATTEVLEAEGRLREARRHFRAGSAEDRKLVADAAIAAGKCPLKAAAGLAPRRCALALGAPNTAWRVPIYKGPMRVDYLATVWVPEDPELPDEERHCPLGWKQQLAGGRELLPIRVLLKEGSDHGGARLRIETGNCRTEAALAFGLETIEGELQLCTTREAIGIASARAVLSGLLPNEEAVEEAIEKVDRHVWRCAACDHRVANGRLLTGDDADVACR